MPAGADGSHLPARARVPASSANLGPGFDVLAVALDLELTVRAVPFEGRRIVASGLGSDEVAADDTNLVWRGVEAFCDQVGAARPDVTLRCHNQIPLERGLGSSAAAAVAGLVLARRLTATAVADQELIELATRVEGHADNAAAALLGGVVVAGARGPARRFEPSRALRPLVCIPSERSSTRVARAMVPSEVGLRTMVDTVRHATLVLTGLAGLAAWDPAAMTDAVHEPPRLTAMSGSRRIIDAVREAGHAACLSGAGPTVLVVVAADDAATPEWLAGVAGDAWTVRPLRWDRAGARVDEPAVTGS